MIKLPASLRNLTRKVTGSGSAQPITPRELQILAADERVLTVSVGMLRPGAIDPALPGEQRTASLVTLAAAVADAGDRPIILHCG